MLFKNAPWLSMSFPNQQTEGNKLINWKQKASPPPNSHIPSWMCPKTIASRMVRYDTQNRDQNKNQNPQTKTN